MSKSGSGKFLVVLLIGIALICDECGSSKDTSPSTASSSGGTSNEPIRYVSPDANLTSYPITNSWIICPMVDRPCSMTIHAPSSRSVYVYFQGLNAASKNFAVLVKAGTSYTFDTPVGSYTCYYASGETWYGTEYKFGSNTSYAKCDTRIENEADYYSATEYELTLYAVQNGNMSTSHISASQFPG